MCVETKAMGQETELRRAARASGARAVAEGKCRRWDVTYGDTLNPKLRARASKRQHGGRRQDGLSQERQDGLSQERQDGLS